MYSTVCVCVGVCVFPNPESLSLATSKPQVTWSFPNFIIVTQLVALDCENLPIPDLNPNSKLKRLENKSGLCQFVHVWKIHSISAYTYHIISINFYTSPWNSWFMGDFLGHSILLWFYMASVRMDCKAVQAASEDGGFAVFFNTQPITKVTAINTTSALESLEVYILIKLCSGLFWLANRMQHRNIVVRYGTYITCILTWFSSRELKFCPPSFLQKRKLSTSKRPNMGGYSFPSLGHPSQVIGRCLKCHQSMKINQRSRYWEDTIWISQWFLLHIWPSYCWWFRNPANQLIR